MVIRDLSIVGCIHVVGCNVEVHDSTISGGHAVQGGDIYVANGNLEINHSTITGNTAVQGGGIYARRRSIEINHSIDLEQHGHWSRGGGAVAIGGDAMGGGLFFAGSNIEINHTIFSSNMAIGGPGGNAAASTSVAVAGGGGGNGGNGLGGGMYLASAHVINLDHGEFDQQLGRGRRRWYRRRSALTVGSTGTAGAQWPRTEPAEERLAGGTETPGSDGQNGGREASGEQQRQLGRLGEKEAGCSSFLPSRSTSIRMPWIRAVFIQGSSGRPAESAARVVPAEPAATAARAATKRRPRPPTCNRRPRRYAGNGG